MKRILLSGVAVAILSSLAGCAPYYWEDNYQGDRVNLDGPLRRNIDYVSGGTTFQAPDQAVQVETAAAPAGVNYRVVPQQAAVQTVAAPAAATLTTNTVALPANSAAFAAPITGAASGAVSSVNVVSQPMVASAASQAATMSTSATVPAAYANAGDAANLQTRRVGDVGLIVFSNLIGDETAKGAAQRSCAQISKTATTSEPTDIQLGIRQLNFRCG